MLNPFLSACLLTFCLRISLPECLIDRTLLVRQRNVRIDRRCRYILMAEHLLDGSQIDPSVQVMCGETVTEHVWRHPLAYARQLCFALTEI
jgi:hypothetical protein